MYGSPSTELQNTLLVCYPPRDRLAARFSMGVVLSVREYSRHVNYLHAFYWFTSRLYLFHKQDWWQVRMAHDVALIMLLGYRHAGKATRKTVLVLPKVKSGCCALDSRTNAPRRDWTSGKHLHSSREERLISNLLTKYLVSSPRFDRFQNTNRYQGG